MIDVAYLEHLFGLKDQVAVITGGGGILCGCIARALARAGARLAVLDVNQEAAQTVAGAIAAAGGEALPIRCDVLDRASVEAAAGSVLEAFGRVDILINGAGGNRREASTSPELSFFDLPADAAQWVFNLNFIGTLLPCQIFGRLLAKNGRGAILNISSLNASRPLTRIPAYSAAKAAVSNFTQWLAVHMAQEYSPDIRVNAIAPGFFLTNQNRFLLTDERTGKLSPRGQTIIDHTPMGRFGEPEELISTTLWLLGGGASFVTGIVVLIDGGFSAFAGV